ncbi:MAG: hypothetical protein ACOCWO_00820 [Candidatus Muiribacteriaceae bacterium]
MKNIDRLIFQTEAFDFSEQSEKLFNLAMLESFGHHYNYSGLYRKVCQKQGVKPFSVTHYKEIPYTFVSSLKSHKFITGEEKDVEISLSSSGTGGKKTFIYLDMKSLQRIERIVHNIFGALGMVSDYATNYICFTYDPEIAGDVGTAFSDKMLTGLTGEGEVFYTMKYSEKEKDFLLDTDLTIKKLREYCNMPIPLRILGFPAHLYFTLQQYYDQGGRQLNMPEGSFIITGGGWKNHTGQEIPKEEFKKMLSDMLGIPVQNIRDHYGMVEHGIPYVDCEHGNMHVPSYSRCHTFDPVTGEIHDKDHEGLLMLFSPYCNSYPSISLISTDKVVIRDDCPCGRGKYIDLKGRAGKKKHKGCALVALDKLRGQIDSK